MASKKTPIEAFLALSDVEKDAAVADLDRRIPLSQTKPLTPAERKEWIQTRKHLLGRPKTGHGSKAISVTIEQSLLKRADRYAKRHAMNRSQLIATGLKLAMQQGS